MSYQKVQLKTGAWRGDRDIFLKFPSDWKINIQGANPPKSLTDSEIRNSLLKPINTNSLSNLAKGKSKAVIVIDDIMRPTPTSKLLPFLVEELNKSGISNNQINIIIAGGSHQKANRTDIELKVGKNLAKKIKVIVHNDQAEDLVYLGKSSLSVPIYINKTYIDSDLKITVGGVYPHPDAGYSGGAKTIVPGVCGFKTISFLHANILPVFMEGNEKNAFRGQIIEMANKAKPDYCINLVLTPKREIGGLYAGEMIESHKKAANAVKTCYKTETAKGADLVVSNSYPFDGSYYFFSRGFWPMGSGRLNNKRVLIVNGSLTQKLYNFKPLPLPRHKHLLWILRKLALILMAWKSPRLMWFRFKKYLFVSKPSFLLFYTGEANEEELKRHFPNATIFNSWDKLLKHLQNFYSKKSAPVNVAVYPYAALQLSNENI